MIKLTKREWDIVQFLFEQEAPVTIESLASHFSVSARTVRSDLHYIELYLKSLDINMERRGGMGVWIDDKFLAINKLGSKMQYMDNAIYRVFSKSERVEKILGILFLAESYETLQNISEYIFVNRSTVSKSLEEASTWLKDRGLLLKKKPNCGIALEADERTFRFAWLEYVLQTFPIEVIYNITHTKQSFNRTFRYEHLQELCDVADTLWIIGAIEELSQQVGVAFSDETMCEQIIYLCISVYRVQLGHTMESSANNRDHVMQSFLYEAVAVLMKRLGERYDVLFSENEIYWATVKFMISRIKYVDEIRCTYQSSQVEADLADQYIRQAGDFLNVPLHQDLLLRSNLQLHIRVTMARAKYGVVIKNPLTEQVKNEYPDCFEKLRRITQKIHEKYAYPDSEDEIGYITMHILGAVERLRNNVKACKVRTLVACAAASGTSRLLRARLESEFEELEIIGEVSISKMCQNTQDADLVITTIPVRDTLLIPIITVSPLLTSRERARVQNAINELRGHRVNEPENRVAEILDVVRKYNKIENEGLLTRMLEQQLYGRTQFVIREGDIMLTDMLDLNRIKMNVKIDNKTDAIRKAGQLLVDNDMAEPSYTDAMLQLTKELGNYIVIAPGVAMPHARADAGAKKTGFAIIIPQSPVEFGHPKNDPVRIILALTATDNKSHLQAMRELSLLMANEEAFNEVIDSKSAKELLNRIKRFEESLENKSR